MSIPMRRSILAAVCMLAVGSPTFAQDEVSVAERRAERHESERKLESIAIIERKLMLPMRDGVR
ncbi:MAG: hypothetical protein ACRELX_07450, partial [Longimicrobiales bacterium]